MNTTDKEENTTNKQEEPSINLSDKTGNEQEELKKIPTTIWNFITSIFSFNQDQDVNPIEVSKEIEKSVEFTGHNVWVLICSIIIACIGLNLNSPAVIIGAMLISPLMGPIRGIGLAVGTNNFKLLIFSLINFGVATGVSIIVSFIYFKLAPIKEETPEILDRVETHILSVLIALFGGLAGIIAASKNDNSTVVPGVAIATALMPPLCVAGYGLATGHYLDYFLGAFYLFLINSIFICLTTIIVVRYLRFPLVSYLNKKRERKIKLYIGVFLLIILIPSAIKFVDVWRKSIFKANVEMFVETEITPILKQRHLSLVNNNADYENKSVTLTIFGEESISQPEIELLATKLKKVQENSSFNIIQNKVKSDVLSPEYYIDIIDNYKRNLDEQIAENEDLQKQLNSNFGKALDMTKTESRLKLITEFSPLLSFSASNAYVVNMQNNNVDTILQFRALWNDSTLNENRTNKLRQFISTEFNTNEFELIESNN